MSGSALRRLIDIPSATGLVARLAATRARARGVSLAPLLADSGLSAAQIADPGARLPVSHQIEFLNRVAEVLDDDMLGVSLAMDYELRSAGLFYYVLASSATLREVFMRGARFTAIVNEGVVQQCVDGPRIGLTLRYRGIRRHDDRHQIEFWVVTLLRICRKLSGVGVRPLRVRLAHLRARGTAALTKLAGCGIEFGAPVDEILFARECGALRVRNADPFLNRLLEQMCEQVLSRRRRASESFTYRVENVVAPLLPHGKARTKFIAAELGISERTLARRLAEEGVTFTQVVTRLRLDLASRYLGSEQLPISRVAWLLGYREVGAFSHAFRRWTGKTPREVLRRKRWNH